jgi:hydrogenase-1 operon protein HyaF
VSRLTDIPIRIESADRIQSPRVTESPRAVAGLGGGVMAILAELVGLLERLASGELPATIDLRSLPMSPQDRVALQGVLGNGEVQATLDALGLSSIRETRVPGIWWVEHRDPHGELIAESIEVTRMPQILVSAVEEIVAGAAALRAQIATTPAVHTSPE